MTHSTTIKRSTVAEFLTNQIAICGKSQKEIAHEAGYDSPNIITMFKQGLTKVPINKVGPLAKSLGVDPAYLLRLVMLEYIPETWHAIEEILGSIVTENEREIINLIREETDYSDPKVSTVKQKELFKRAALYLVTTRD